jgi:hypothetical protein
MSIKSAAWFLWVTLTALAVGIFSNSMFSENGDGKVFMPGKTSHGHHQIEMACATCHTPLMGVKDSACIQCHGEDLEHNNDSHPKSKFKDPRNADRLLKLDASRCVTCHREHVEGQTHTMGVTLPKDYCYRCHEDIAKDRPSHAGMGFETCATAGCHNYHDNTALYEDFLMKHIGEKDVLENNIILTRSKNIDLSKILTKAQANFAQFGGEAKDSVLNEWEHSAHAKAAVNCSDCHQQNGGWVKKPDHNSCNRCHSQEVKNFKEGMHGMRLNQNLSPLTPAMAEIPMHKEAMHKTMSCSACHNSHSYNREEASFKACITCHNDRHTNQFEASKHFSLWIEKGLEGGVSCATCHMPRLKNEAEPEKNFMVQHNQNDNLRPNEKMIRSVCLNCHGLQFSLDALGDKDLIERNFIGLPTNKSKSIDMAKQRH